MTASKKFYITTTLPYVNSRPHMGHALEFVQADVIARYHREILGEETVFNTGTDEHGQKIYQKAVEAGKDPKVYVDEYAGTFKDVLQRLNVRYTHFIRTTDPGHIAAAQEFWKRCEKNGDIYKQNYKIKYCVGCELEKTDSELDEQGRCALHPNLSLEVREEENYFFRFKKYEQPLLRFYGQHKDFVVPASRFNEIQSFVQQGLQDFSISRVKEKLPWGVPVPGDDSQVMYVWFDALINYISTLGWPSLPQESEFKEFWGEAGRPNAVQIAGKDNLRQQSAMWQAMLMSAGVPNSRQIIIHGFINAAGGQKMSKSLGNVVDPLELVGQYGTDALRYWFAREMSTFEDGEFVLEKFKESYNAGLANGIGNLTSRILKMAATNKIPFVNTMSERDFFSQPMPSGNTKYKELLNDYKIQEAADFLWKEIKWLDVAIQETEPFKVIKTNFTQGEKIIQGLLFGLWKVALYLKPFLPETSKKILDALADIREDNIPRLFPRIE